MKRNNLRSILLKERSIRLIALVLAVMMVFSVAVFATEDVDPGSISPQTLVMGASELDSLLAQEGTVIEEIDQLVQLSKEVNDGDSKKGEVFTLAAEMKIGWLDEWTPIGTKDNPFEGVFNGNDFTVTGINKIVYKSLFGYIKGGAVVNLNLLVTTTDVVLGQSDVAHNGLFFEAEGATINCNIQPFYIRTASVSSYARAFSAEGWVSGGVITSANQLVDIAGKVNTGLITTEPVGSLTLGSNIDLSSVSSFIPIGNEIHPFKGNIDGKGYKLTGLTIDNPSGENQGIFGVATDSTFRNISLVGVDLNASTSVGALVGKLVLTAAPTIAPDAIAYNCFASGKIEGTESLGGLVGMAEVSGLGYNLIFEYCYTSTNIEGAMYIGGIIGKIDEPVPSGDWGMASTCFSTGSLLGNMRIGGILGSGNGEPIVEKSASSGPLSGAVNLGGIVGALEWGSTSPIATGCYSSSNITAISDSGGIFGQGGFLEESNYFSGTISGPDPMDFFFNAGMGIGSGHRRDFYTNPNAVFSSYYYMNEDAPSAEDCYKQNASSSSPFYTKFFDNTAINPDPAYFNSSSGLNFPASTPPGDEYLDVATEGRYPTLIAFGGASVPAGAKEAFKVFSDLTTNAATMSLPIRLYTIKSGGKYVASVDKTGNTEYKLPQIAGVTWRIDGESTFDDETVPGASNTVTIDKATGSIYFEQPMSAQQEIIISADVEAIDGLELKHNVTLMDTKLDPVYSLIPKAFYDNATEAAKGTDTVSKNDFSQRISFPEAVKLPGGSNEVVVEVFENNDFTKKLKDGKALMQIVPNTDNSVVQLTLDKGDIEYGRSYIIKFVAGSTLKEAAESENEFVRQYWIKSAINHVPEVSFDDTMPILSLDDQSYTKASNPSTGVLDLQMIYMVTNEQAYRGYTDGVIIKDEGYVKLKEDDTDIKFEKPAGSSATKQTFNKIPGEYKLTYSVDDPDGAGRSNEAVRTYRVTGPVVLTQGGKPFSKMDVTIASKEIKEIIAIMEEKKGTTLDEAVASYLKRSYIDSGGTAQLKATRTGYDGKLENLPINFNVVGLKIEDLINGTDKAYVLTAGNLSFMYTIKIEGLAMDRQIVVASSHYDTERYLSTGKALAYFKAKVVKKSNPNEVTNDPIGYDFSQVESWRYNTPQEVVIYAKGSEIEIMGKSYRVETTVTITIIKSDRYIRPEEEVRIHEDDIVEYWDNKINLVKNTTKDRVFDFDITYDQSRAIPRDFLITLKNKGDVTVNFTYPSGIIATLTSDYVDETISDEILFYTLPIERMYRLGVTRDAGGKTTHQFFVAKSSMPSQAVISMELDKSLPDTGLIIYRINDSKNTYEKIREIDSADLENGRLILQLESPEGAFVITDAKLDN